jgi:hypothetical protein
MIQLANDPNASRSFQPAQSGEAKASAHDARRARSGHSWPFLSQQSARPAREESTDKPAAQQSGS